MQNQDVFLQSSLDYFKEFNLEANRECEHLNAELEAEKVRYRELLEAQKNNAEIYGTFAACDRSGKNSFAIKHGRKTKRARSVIVWKQRSSRKRKTA